MRSSQLSMADGRRHRPGEVDRLEQGTARGQPMLRLSKALCRAAHVACEEDPNVKRVELAKVFPKEDGSPTPAYRMADLYFDDYAAASAAVVTPEGQAYARDGCNSAPQA